MRRELCMHHEGPMSRTSSAEWVDTRPHHSLVYYFLACVNVEDALLYPLAAPARTSARVSTGFPL